MIISYTVSFLSVLIVPMVNFRVRAWSRRHIPLLRRDREALSARERMFVREIRSNITCLCALYPIIRGNRRAAIVVKAALVEQYVEMLRIMVVEVVDRPPRTVGRIYQTEVAESQLSELAAALPARSPASVRIY